MRGQSLSPYYTVYNTFAFTNACTEFQVRSKHRLESYGDFLRNHPSATKKQRIHAIQQFYDNLLK